MPIPTEPIGSIPRPRELLEALAAAPDESAPALGARYERELMPSLFELKTGNCDFARAPEKAPRRARQIIRRHPQPDQRIFVGVIATISARVETPEEVCARVLEAAEYIPVERLGRTDDCGFAPFCDDQPTTRETAFAKISDRVAGTAGAARRVGTE